MTKMICLGILMIEMYAKSITIKKKKDIHSMTRKYLDKNINSVRKYFIFIYHRDCRFN